MPIIYLDELPPKQRAHLMERMTDALHRAATKSKMGERIEHARRKLRRRREHGS